MTNPFVYGEIVPRSAFVDREAELERLVGDLLSGQKIFLISPRRYGKSSLVRRALEAAGRRAALTLDVSVSSYSSYSAFLEGYALDADTPVASEVIVMDLVFETTSWTLAQVSTWRVESGSISFRSMMHFSFC